MAKSRTSIIKLIADIGQPARSIKELETRTRALTRAVKEVPTQGSPAFNQFANSIKATGETSRQAEQKLVKFLGSAEREIKQGNQTLKGFRKNLRTATTPPGSLNALRREIAKLDKEIGDLVPGTERFIKTSRRLSIVRERVKSLERGFGDARRGVGEYERSFKGLIGVAGKFALAAGAGFGISEITRAAAQGIRIFADFEQQIATLGAISGATAEDLGALRQQALDVGGSTQFTATQVAELQTELARLGFTAKEITDATEDVANVAIATGEDIGKSSKVIGQAIRAYGLESTEAGRIADVLTASFNSSGLQLETFAEASKLLAPVAKVLGISLEESTAAIGLLADQGLEGTIATQTLGSALQRLADPTKRNSKALKELGVSFFDSQGQFIGLAEALKVFNEATSDLTDEQRLAQISQVFGVNAAKNFALLLDGTKEVNGELLQGGDALDAYTKQLAGSAGEAKRTADVVGDTLSQDFLKLKSAVEAATIELLGQEENGIRPLIQSLTELAPTLIQGLQPLLDVTNSVNSLTIAFINLGDAFGLIAKDNKDARENFSLIAFAIRSATITLQTFINLITISIQGLATLTKTVKDSVSAFSSQNVLTDRAKRNIEFLKSSFLTLISPITTVVKKIEELTGIFAFQERIIGGLGNTIKRFRNESNDLGAFPLPAQDLTGEDLTQRIEQLKKQRKEFSEQRKGLQENSLEYNILTNSINKTEKELSKLGETTGQSGESTKEAITRYRDLQNEANALKNEVRDLRASGLNAGTQIDELAKLEKRISEIDKVFDSSKDTVSSVSSGIQQLRKEVQNATEALEKEQDLSNYDKLAERLRTAKDELEKLERAAQIARTPSILVEEETRRVLRVDTAGLEAERRAVLQNSELTNEQREEVERQFAGRIERLKIESEVRILEAKNTLDFKSVSQRQANEIQLDNLRQSLAENERNRQQAAFERADRNQKELADSFLNTANFIREERERISREIATAEIRELDKVRDEAVNNSNLTNTERERILEEYAAKRKEIETRLEVDLLNQKISLLEVGSAQRLALEQQVADLQFQIQLDKINRELAAERKAADERAKIRKEVIQGTLQVADEVAKALFEIEATQIERTKDRRLQAVEDEFKDKIDAAEGDADAQLALQQELDRRKEQIEKEAFERQKRLSIAQALVNGALAITRILADVPKFDFGIATAIQIALATATTAAQIATISAQQFAKGGMFTGPKMAGGGYLDRGKLHSQGGMPILDPNTGQKVAEIERNEGVLTRSAMLSNRKVSVSGTPLDIASYLNHNVGGGVKYSGARPVRLFRSGGMFGQRINKMASGGKIRISKSIAKMQQGAVFATVQGKKVAAVGGFDLSSLRGDINKGNDEMIKAVGVLNDSINNIPSTLDDLTKVAKIIKNENITSR